MQRFRGTDAQMQYSSDGGTPVRGESILHTRKPNPRREYRLRQRERIEASPLMGEKFPQLKALRADLRYYDGSGTSQTGAMKCTLNVKQARSAFWIACPVTGCTGGDFDLSEALAEAVAGRRKVVTGEARCQGKRERGDGERVSCETLLRYKLNLNYD